METGSCTVRILGDASMEVLKEQVTPAEVAVLRALHNGDEGVLNVVADGMDRRSHGEEFERLARIYGVPVVTAAFPGANPKLPVKFKDIGIDSWDRKPKAKPASAPAPADLDDDDPGGDEGNDGPQDKD